MYDCFNSISCTGCFISYPYLLKSPVHSFNSFFFNVNSVNSHYLSVHIRCYEPIPVARQSKASVCGRLPAEIAGSNPTGGMDVCLL